jgi:hypothetical protein
MATSFLNQNNLSRGLRNNNPGNLIYTDIGWQGKIPYAQNSDWIGNPGNIVKYFEQYTDVEHGIRAAAEDIINDVKQHGYSLAQLINEYAPPSENNTAGYIQSIVNVTGLNPDVPITWNFVLLAEVLRAIFEVENGANNAALISDATIVDSINLLPAVILDELGQYVAEHSTSIGTGTIVVGLGLLTFAGYKIYKAAA